MKSNWISLTYKNTIKTITYIVVLYTINVISGIVRNDLEILRIIFNNNIMYISHKSIEFPIKKDGSEDKLVKIIIDETSMNNPQLKISFVNKLLFCEKLSIIKNEDIVDLLCDINDMEKKGVLKYI